MSYLITGATGFVGTQLISEYLAEGVKVKVLVRAKSLLFPDIVEQYVVDDLSEWTEDAFACKLIDENVFEGVETVIHLAARVHVMNDESLDPFYDFRKQNCDATNALAKIAAKAGVKRFVFLSSVKVNGEKTTLNKPFTPDFVSIPTDPYGLSKYEAEKSLLTFTEKSTVEVVIIRPPLVYGPGVKANFASMMGWMKKEIPLPFGAVQNKRSLVALDNLVDFIALCADRERSPKAANQIFLISDGEDVSTTQLLQKVAKAFNKKAILLPIPVGLMTYIAKLLGKGDVANRLFGSLQLDSSKAYDLLRWKPVTTMDEQLKKTAESFKK